MTKKKSMGKQAFIFIAWAVVLSGALWMTTIRPVPGLASAQWITGNSPANICNNGLAVAQGDYIYYIDYAGDIYAGNREKIFRLKKGDAAPMLLAEDEAWNLNIDGDWLYYSNWSDNHCIYKIRTDGSDKIKVTEDPANNFTIADGRAVYVKLISSNIYIIDLSSGDRTEVRLNSDRSENLNVADGWVYYNNVSDGYRPYKIRMDGTERTRISDDQIMFMVVAEGWIYYSNFSDGDKLYRISTNGTGRTKLCDDRAGFINVAGGYVYYTNASDSDSLYRIKTDGSGRRRIFNIGTGPMPINVVADFIYYNQLFVR